MVFIVSFAFYLYPLITVYTYIYSGISYLMSLSQTEGNRYRMFYLPLCIQHLVQVLAHNRHSLNVCWINEQIFSFFATQSRLFPFQSFVGLSSLPSFSYYFLPLLCFEWQRSLAPFFMLLVCVNSCIKKFAVFITD